MSTARPAVRFPSARRTGAAMVLAAGGFAASAPAADPCNAHGGCRPAGTHASHGRRCECEEESRLESATRRFREWRRVTHAGLRMKWEGHRREKALEHHECPPYVAPAWGYHQTCWRQFPEQAIPPCPPYRPPAGHPAAGPPGLHGPGDFAPPAPMADPTNLAAPMQPVPAPLPTAIDPPADDLRRDEPGGDSTDPADAPADPDAGAEPTPEPSVPRSDDPLVDPFADPTESNADEVRFAPPSRVVPASATGRATLAPATRKADLNWF